MRLAVNERAVNDGQEMWGDFVSVLTDHEGQVIRQCDVAFAEVFGV